MFFAFQLQSSLSLALFFVSSRYTRPTFRNTSLSFHGLYQQYFVLRCSLSVQVLTAKIWYTFRYVLLYVYLLGAFYITNPDFFFFSSTSSDLYEIEVFRKLNWKLPRLTFPYHSLTHVLPSISLCTTFFLFKVAHTAVPSTLTLSFV